MKFTESQLEQAFIALLEAQGYPHVRGEQILRGKEEVMIREDLQTFLQQRYAEQQITPVEIFGIIRELEKLPASDLYETNKTIMNWVRDGFLLKRENHKHKDIFISLIDYEHPENNIFKIVNQLEIQGFESLRIPDGILYINGLPLVVFEFKSSIREEVRIHEAYRQLTVRYRKDIPDLFKYNAFCIIGDGVNTKAGSLFAPYEFFYAWRKIAGLDQEIDPKTGLSTKVHGINSMYTLIKGMLDKHRLCDIIHNFIYLPDSSKKEEKILCRYPQYYAATMLFENIKKRQLPHGDGKGGTYFGATGCGKSFTMLYLARLLMKSLDFASPTIVLITDRTDLDDQLSTQFTAAKDFIGDNVIKSVGSRTDLRAELKGRNSGGVFLTTIHKFNEDTDLLTERSNVICISDEAHRSQTNLDQKVRVTEKGVKKSFGFAKHLHDSLPNATYVGFTGTPIDATMDVFGEIVDTYTMTESVMDEITVRIVYEGRAAKVLLENQKLQEIEDYYSMVADSGGNEYQVDESKRQITKMRTILGDPGRIEAIAKDFVQHYETRVQEGSTLLGKAMFVCSTREIAYQLYQEIVNLRPAWADILAAEEGVELTEKDRKELKPMARVNMVMTRTKDDEKDLWDALGTQDYRKELDRQFKYAKSNFKIAIVVDMWLTGFDVPFLDTMYIDKPLQEHSLIQTISRVNRKFEGKSKGLVVDYIGIKKQMNLALKQYSTIDSQNFEDIEQSIVVVKDHVDLLEAIFHAFNYTPYFTGSPLEQLNTLNKAAEYVQLTQKLEKRFMNLVKRMKAAYDICSGSAAFTNAKKDKIHFFIAVRSIVFKLTKGEAPDTDQMNAKVREMIQEAIKSEGVQEIFKLGEEGQKEVDIFEADYLAKIDKIKLPHTKIKLLQKLLAKAIDDFKRINKVKGVDFSKKMQHLVEKYNERKEADVLQSEVLEDFTNEIIDLYYAMKKEKESFAELGIDFEEKAFYDILKALAVKYDFVYPEDKLVHLAQEVKEVVNDKAKYTDWSKREDIKAELKVDLIILLAENDYPPVDRDEVYKEIFEQAENFKKYQR